MAASRIYLFRHGETDWNVQRRFQGSTPHVELNEHGRGQAQALGERLKDKSIRQIYSSPLVRAKQTAAIVGQACGAEVLFHDNLRERAFGRLEGLTRDEIAQTYPDIADFLKMGRKWEVPVKNGIDYRVETIADTQARMHTAILSIAQSSPVETIAISTHGASIYNFLCCIAAPPEDFRVGNAEVFVIEHDAPAKNLRYLDRLMP